MGLNLVNDFAACLEDIEAKEAMYDDDYAQRFFGQGSSIAERFSSAADYENWRKRQYAYGYNDDYYEDDWRDYLGDTPRKKHKTRRSGRKRGRKKKGSSMFSSQKFINGREVDDDEFENYQTVWPREGSNDDEDDDSKIIRFYDDIADSEHYDEFSNLHEFDEWCDANDIHVPNEVIYDCVWNEEVHCCLDPTYSEKTLIAARSYGDLVWELTGGDADLIEHYSKSFNKD